MRKFYSFLILLTVVAFTAKADLPSLSSIRENNKGVDQLKTENAVLAQDFFIKALGKNPLSPEIQLNLGLSFYHQNQMERAQAAYETSLKFAQDPETKFSALFNLGELAQKAKEKEKALSFYQQALKIKPDSLETKVNIELLTKQGEGGGGDNKDQQNKDQQKDQQGQGNQDQQEKDDKNEDGDKPEENKSYSKGKPQPRPFKSEELSQSDVNKILDELKQQEQKIRADFNRKEAKEKPRDKDW